MRQERIRKAPRRTRRRFELPPLELVPNTPDVADVEDVLDVIDSLLEAA
jgi:hypothetical protein